LITYELNISRRLSDIGRKLRNNGGKYGKTSPYFVTAIFLLSDLLISKLLSSKI
jgi:hypothetical protein